MILFFLTCIIMYILPCVVTMNFHAICAHGMLKNGRIHKSDITICYNAEMSQNTAEQDQ